MKFGILGPLLVTSDLGNHVELPPRQQRVLAVLLLEQGRAVPAARLPEWVWDGPPATARRQLQNCVSTLRQRMRQAGAADGFIISDRSGYRARLDGHELDAAIFAQHVQAATQMLAAGQLTGAVTRLRGALGLWRGPALAGMSSWAISARAARLDEHRLAAVEHYAEAELALGHLQVIGELTEWVRAYPLRERLADQLMRALYYGGRTADALEEYQRLRGRLAEECGLDPGQPLRDLHVRILRGEEPRPQAAMPSRPRGRCHQRSFPPTSSASPAGVRSCGYCGSG